MNRVKSIVHAQNVYKDGYTGKHICIAILDTGIYLHPDIKYRKIIFQDFVHKRARPYDDNGHGTHVAGIICGDGRSSGGKITGMAPGADLVVCKVLDEKGNGDSKDVLAAIRWIYANNDKLGINLLNFSVGFVPGSQMEEQKQLLEGLEKLWDAGIMVVTAAGNNGPGESSISVPGISRKLLTVGAFDGADYSGLGPTPCCIMKPEVLAPGTNIKSLDVNGNGYVYKSGTSMAAPIVCGALALALEKFPKELPEELKVRLYDSVSPRGSQIHKKSWGILHVDNLLKMN